MTNVATGVEVGQAPMRAPAPQSGANLGLPPDAMPVADVKALPDDCKEGPIAAITPGPLPAAKRVEAPPQFVTGDWTLPGACKEGPIAASSPRRTTPFPAAGHLKAA